MRFQQPAGLQKVPPFENSLPSPTFSERRGGQAVFAVSFSNVAPYWLTNELYRDATSLNN